MFYSLVKKNNEATNDILKNEYKKAYKIGNIRLGSKILFFKAGFKIYFIFYSNIYRYFRRIKVVPTHMCCSRINLEIEYLVICDKKNELAEIQIPDKRAAKILMERLKKLIPNAKVGIKKNREKELKKEFKVADDKSKT